MLGNLKFLRFISCWFLSSSLNSLPSIFSSKMSSNLLMGIISCKVFFFAILKSGGGNRGSTANLNALSSIAGIILARSGHDTSKQGFVLASIRYILNSQSIIKSYPNISKLLFLLLGSNFKNVALNVSVITLYKIIFYIIRFKYFNLREQIPEEIDIFMGEVSFNVLLEVMVGDLVSILKLTVVVTFFLDSVIC